METEKKERDEEQERPTPKREEHVAVNAGPQETGESAAATDEHEVPTDGSVLKGSADDDRAKREARARDLRRQLALLEDPATRPPPRTPREFVDQQTNVPGPDERGAPNNPALGEASKE